MALKLLHYSDIENAYDDPGRIGRLAGTIQTARDEETVVVGTGDNLGPGVLSLITKGRQSIPFFSAIAPDFETFGNHDFDYGPVTLREIVRETPQKWVSANVFDGDERFGTDEGVVPWDVLKVDGERVGFFGVTDPGTGENNPRAADLTFSDPFDAAIDAVDALHDRDVDLIVALSHLGNGDAELANRVDVDVVLGGHVHTERIERLDDVLLTRPGANAETVIEVEMTDDVTVRRHTVDEAIPDRGVVSTVSERMEAAGLDEQVAIVREPVERTERTAYRGESRIGNWVADAYRWAADADVGLQNSGGIRSGPELAGEVTIGDLISVVPFEEPVSVARLSGAELYEVFREAGDHDVGFGEPGWWHAHVSGARLVWNDETHELESATVTGEPIVPDETYTLATTDHLFHTAQEFPTLSEDLRVRSLDVQYEVLASYARTHGIDPALEGRIVRNGHRSR